MEELLKILFANEKKMSLLTDRFNELRRNAAHETVADKVTRAHLVSDIAALKKTNKIIVNHYLGEPKLTPIQIADITKAHGAAENL
jgi:hypothetical protein